MWFTEHTLKMPSVNKQYHNLQEVCVRHYGNTRQKQLTAWRGLHLHSLPSTKSTELLFESHWVWIRSFVNFFLVLPNLQATKAGAASMIHYMVLISARLVLLTLCGWVLCWTLVNLFRSHSVLNLLFLGYPWVLQFYYSIRWVLRNYLGSSCYGAVG